MFFNNNAKELKEKDEALQREKESNARMQKELQELKESLIQSTEQIHSLRRKYSHLINLDEAVDFRQKALDEVRDNLEVLNAKFKEAKNINTSLEQEINLYRDTLEVRMFGLYEPQFSFETSERYKDEIQLVYIKQKEMIKSDKAAVCPTEWTVGGSLAEGKKMTNQNKKLMLYAFNGESDSLIAKVRWNNVARTRERMVKSYEAINKLGQTSLVSITKEYLQLKLEELALTYEYEQKKYEEKEEQRRIREQMRDEEKAQREIEKAQKDAADEERRFQIALDKAKQELGNSSQLNADMLTEKVRLLELKLQEAHDRKERAIALAQLTKVGHIYVISNVGSFGEDVYKIGMTRRLDPLDRVRELGDASVPFQFDVHAIIYSENAPQLEYEIHKKFGDRRLNRINSRKEFFKITLEEIEEFVHQHANAEIQFTKLAEAREYRETMSLLEHLALAEAPSVVQQSRFPDSLI